MDKYWDDYKVGDVISTSGRTVMHADIRLFFGATDASHPAHVDEEYCKEHPFGRIVVPGSLTLGIVDGFAIEALNARRLKVAHYGYDKIRFLAPVFPGDTIHMEVEVLETRDKSAEFGILKLQYDVKNQRNELVAVIIDLQMVERATPLPAA